MIRTSTKRPVQCIFRTGCTVGHRFQGSPRTMVHYRPKLAEIVRIVPNVPRCPIAGGGGRTHLRRHRRRQGSSRCWSASCCMPLHTCSDCFVPRWCMCPQVGVVVCQSWYDGSGRQELQVSFIVSGRWRRCVAGSSGVIAVCPCIPLPELVPICIVGQAGVLFNATRRGGCPRIGRKHCCGMIRQR